MNHLIVAPPAGLSGDILRAVTDRAIVVLDSESVIECCNDTARQLHGRTGAMPPLTDLYEPRLSDLLPAGGVWRGRVECVHASGRAFPADMAITARHPAGGFVLVYQPAPEPAALPGGPLLSKLSHELRSPLNGVVGLTRMLLRKPPTSASDSEVQARQLTMLLASATQMLRTIDQVAGIARLQSGAALSVPAPLDGRDIVAEVALSHQPAATERGLRLLTEVPGQRTPITGDAGMLGRLLSEVVDNAVKYTDGGDIHLRLLDPGDGIVTIEVADDGPVIAADDRARIFEPFERGAAGEAQDDGAAGLGLYFAQQLAHHLGAELSLRSGDSPGTTFAVELPRGSAHIGPA